MKKKNLIIAIFTGIIVAAAAFIDLKLFRGAYSPAVSAASLALGLACAAAGLWVLFCVIKNRTNSDEVSPLFSGKLLLSLLPFLVIEAVILFLTSKTDIPEEDINIYYAHIIAVLSIFVSLLSACIGRKRIAAYIVAVISPFAAFFAEEYILQNPLLKLSPGPLLFGLTLFCLIAFIFYSLFNRTDISILLFSLISIVAGFINYFCLEFRSSPFLPADILSARAALSVAGGYTYNIIPSLGFSLCAFILIIQTAFLFNLSVFKGAHHLRRRLVSLLVSCVAFVGFILYAQTNSAVSVFRLMHNPTEVFASVTHDGYAASFVLNLSSSIKAPSDYSPDKVKSIVSSYTSDSVSHNNDERPNVIVIMNESWADLSVFADYETNEDCFALLNSLDKNVIRGNAHVSIVGGGTPNSEFEFLTGQTLGFFPTGTTPFTGLIKTPMQNLVSQFNDLGYYTVAYHMNRPEIYNRGNVYNYFGFQTFYTDASYDNIEYYGIFPSDKFMFDCIKDIYESSTSPLFLFGVSFQNHGAYPDLGEYPLNNSVKGLDNESVRVYMSLIKETDRAFADFIDYLSKLDRKTVVLMFGDHQPSDEVAIPLMEFSAPKPYYNFDSTATMYERYITPYVIWANYDIDYDAPRDISLNYLSSILMEICGLPKTASQKYLLDLSKQFPVISAKFFTDAEGTVHPIDNYKDYPLLHDYSCLQYNFMMDRKKLIPAFWELN